jgi:hypothetical protein
LVALVPWHVQKVDRRVLEESQLGEAPDKPGIFGLNQSKEKHPRKGNRVRWGEREHPSVPSQSAHTAALHLLVVFPLPNLP